MPFRLVALGSDHQNLNDATELVSLDVLSAVRFHASFSVDADFRLFSAT